MARTSSSGSASHRSHPSSSHQRCQWQRRRSKHYDQKREANRFRSLIIRQLPPDVMSIIFEFCLPDFANHQLELSPYNSKDFSIPFSLGAICSHWREIAWSTPSLWSLLVVHVPSNVSKHKSHITIMTGMAQEWLARSGQLPLSIRITGISGRYGRKALSALADVINQYSNRWSDLDLDMPQHYCKYFHATDNHAPILKSIRIHCPDIVDAVNLNFRLTCPRLERAILSYFPIDIQLDNLTHLTLHSISIADSFLVLRKTPRLVFCKISPRLRRYGDPSIGAPVVTSLRSLIAHFPKDFLNNLIAPHLEELSLSILSPSTRFIASFLRRSACTLRTFSITFNFSPPCFERLMDTLQAMPSLNQLSIISKTSATDYFEKIPDLWSLFQIIAKVLSSQSTSLQEFLPNLKILEYSGNLCVRPGINDDLYGLPPADNAVHGPLHLLKLDLPLTTRISKTMISHLSKLVERGVTVNVVSDSKDILQSSIDHYRCKEGFVRGLD